MKTIENHLNHHFQCDVGPNKTVPARVRASHPHRFRTWYPFGPEKYPGTLGLLRCGIFGLFTSVDIRSDSVSTEDRAATGWTSDRSPGSVTKMVGSVATDRSPEVVGYTDRSPEETGSITLQAIANRQDQSPHRYSEGKGKKKQPTIPDRLPGSVVTGIAKGRTKRQTNHTGSVARIGHHTNVMKGRETNKPYRISRQDQ